jgi:hypothetical protein
MRAASYFAPMASRAGRTGWASLIAIAFVLAAALSCAVDQLVTVSPDQEATAATTADR